jgi:hypothetical protein
MWMFIGIIGFLLTLVFAVLSLISIFRKDGKAKRRGIFALGFLILFIAGVSFSTSSDDTTSTKEEEKEDVKTDKQETEKDTPEKVEEKKEESKEEPLYDIAMTSDEFETKYNEFTATQLGQPDKKIDINVENGEVQDVFQHQINPNVYIQGSVHKKTGMVRDVTVIGSGFEDTNQSFDFIMAVGTIVGITNPTLSADERGNVLMKELDFENTVTNRSKKSVVKNGVEYTLSADDVIGVWFIASNPED